MGKARDGVVPTVVSLPAEIKTAVQALAAQAGGTDRAEYIAALVAWTRCGPAARDLIREEVTARYIPATRDRGGPVTTRRRERTP